MKKCILTMPGLMLLPILFFSAACGFSVASFNVDGNGGEDEQGDTLQEESDTESVYPCPEKEEENNERQEAPKASKLNRQVSKKYKRAKSQPSRRRRCVIGRMGSNNQENPDQT